MNAIPPFPDTPSLRQRVRSALVEDLGEQGDVTTDAIFAADHCSEAVVIAKQAGVAAGLPLFPIVFAELGSLRPGLESVDCRLKARDGGAIINGQVIAELAGPTRLLLAGERTALNFIQRLSGIATQTREYVERAAGRVDICDTRKTTPLWRDMEKYAVACGGGTNHRFGLFDMVMLKDTHADGAGGLAEALRRVQPLRPGLRVAAEARTLEEVDAALAGNADLIMLDNMDTATRQAAIHRIAGRIPIEVTGGITLETIASMAGDGINRVSIGALTHSVRAMDYSMRLKVGGRGRDPRN